MKLAGYLRVSTDFQVENGMGLAVQRSKLRAWARANGHEITEWYADEGESGKEPLDRRVALHTAIQAVLDGKAEGLVATSLDRIARRLTIQEAVLAMIWDAGATVFTLGDGFDSGVVPQDDPEDPMRTAIRQMRGVFAQLERSLIVKRLRDGRRFKATGGGYVGGHPPYGYRLGTDGRLEPVATEQAVIELIRTMRAQRQPLRAIAASLNEAGHRTNRGSPWHPEAVRRVVRRG